MLWPVFVVTKYMLSIWRWRPYLYLGPYIFPEHLSILAGSSPLFSLSHSHGARDALFQRHRMFQDKAVSHVRHLRRLNSIGFAALLLRASAIGKSSPVHNKNWAL